MTKPSWKQKEVRRIFRASCDCFNIQPDAGGSEPPGKGPRNKSWWFDAASSPLHKWLYRGRTLTWAGALQPSPRFFDINLRKWPLHAFNNIKGWWYNTKFVNDAWSIRWDPEHFLFEGRYPWFEGRDPDEVAVMVWKLVREDVSTSNIWPKHFLLIPSETLERGAWNALSVAILYFTYLDSALVKTGKSMQWIYDHVTCVYVKGSAAQMGICWYKTSMGNTVAIRPTVALEDIPDDIEEAMPWTNWRGEHLITRFNGREHFDPWIRPPPPASNRRYYNYFMRETLNSYFAGITPDWCLKPVTHDAYVQDSVPDNNFGGSDSLVIRIDTAGPAVMRTFLRAAGEDPLFAVRIYIEGADNTTGEDWRRIGCFATDPDNWTEDTITWNNQPAIGTLIDHKVIDAAGWYAFLCKGHFSVCLKFIDESMPAVGKFDVVGRSSEHAVAQHLPYYQF